MALRDEIKEARRELMKNGSRKEKIAYFFDYYTLHVVVVIAVLAFAIWGICSVVLKPEPVLTGIVLNVNHIQNEDPEEELAQEFVEYLDKNPSKYELSLNTSLSFFPKTYENSDYENYQASQVVMVQCSAGTVDFMLSPVEHITEYGYNEMFRNLEDFLTEEEMALYEPYFLYIDGAVQKEKLAAAADAENTDDIPSPDPTKPEEMEDPIPIFIDVSKCEKISKLYGGDKNTIAFGMVSNSSKEENISLFLKYLFEE